MYLRNLPTLVTRTPSFNSTFGRASASFTSAAWASSSSHLQAAALTTSNTTDGCSTTLSAPPIKEPLKPHNRYLFADTELELVTRNAEEILQLHERFVSELQEALEPLGFKMQSDIDEQPTHDQADKLESAIRAVSAKFATEVRRLVNVHAMSFKVSLGLPVQRLSDLLRRTSRSHGPRSQSFSATYSRMGSV